MNVFKYEEVVALDKVQNKTLDKVFYHYWINISQAEALKVLDSMELLFADGESLALSARTDECLKLVTLDLKQDQEELAAQFQCKIVLNTEDVSDSTLWANTGTLHHISLRKSSDGQYLNDAILLAFEHKEIVVFYDGDSIGVEEVFEEIDD